MENQKTLIERGPDLRGAYITTKPGLMGGRATIRGMRFTVGDLLELLADGLTEKEILEQHPILEKEDISAALVYASLRMKKG